MKKPSVLNRFMNSPAARPLLLIAALLLAWEFFISVLGLPAYLIPTPRQVLGQQVENWPKLLTESAYTTTAAVLGFALSAVVGIPIAMLIAYSRTLERYIYPLLVFSQSVPKIAVAPLLVVWFGFGIFPKVLVAFLLGVFPVVVSTVTGFKSVDSDMLDLAKSMRASRLKVFWHVALPHSLPHIFSGLKVSITLAVVGAVVGEFVGSNSGIGYLLQIANGNFDLPLMFAALLVLSTIGVILFAAVDALERWMLPWHTSARTTLQTA